MAQPWRKIILSIIILAFLLGSSGCQVGKSLDSLKHEINRLPDRIAQSFIDLLGGVKDVGDALAERVSDIVHNMTGR